MAQPDTSTGTGSTDTPDDNPLTSLTETVSAAIEHIGDMTESELSDADDVSLVELRNALRTLEDVSKDARKTADGEVKERIEPGDDLLGLTHVESHRKHLTEDPTTIIGRAVNQGIDYTDFVRVNASDLADTHPDLSEVGESEYTYVR